MAYSNNSINRAIYEGRKQKVRESLTADWQTCKEIGNRCGLHPVIVNYFLTKISDSEVNDDAKAGVAYP